MASGPLPANGLCARVVEPTGVKTTLYPAESETYHGWVRTAEDALLLIVHTHYGMLPAVRSRLVFHDRQTLIRSGAVFICRRDNDVKRWTDGRLWTQSHSSGNKFLVSGYVLLMTKPPTHPLLQMYRERADGPRNRGRRRQIGSGQQAKNILDIFGSWPDDPMLLELRKKVR
jgi:hypothetical protein